VTRQARAWTLADPVPQAYRALALAHSAAGQFDSAAAAAAEGARRLGARAGTLPFLQATLQMRVDPAGALATLRATLRSADTAALAANGGADRFFFVVRAMDVASLAGSARDVDAVAGLAAAVQPTMPGTAYPTATMTRWMAAAQRLAMGMPGPGPRLGVDSAIAAVERAPERVAQAARWQLSNIPYVAFATTRDPRYLATFRRWRGDDTSAYPELDALAALAGGDTAAAQRAARQFPSADSTRAAGTGWLNPSRWAARAAVLAELGDARGALATYEVLDPTRFSESGPMDPGWAVYARTFLARGRLYEQLGERAKAAAAYERFLTLWKDADPALQPQLREARAGLARVRDAQGTQPVGGA
jgi:tetratricopeptide (TPR) repeat protein